MKPDTNTMSTDHNSDVLKIFGIDSNIIEHYDIFHRKDGVHIILKLINREQRCPVCQTRTTKVVNYIDKKIKHSVVSTSSCFIDYHARRYRCPACTRLFMNPILLLLERKGSRQLPFIVFCRILKSHLKHLKVLVKDIIYPPIQSSTYLTDISVHQGFPCHLYFQ